jgi:hypothetical protein
MSVDEATKIMTDVATKRRPHTRNEIKEAFAVLEPPAVARTTKKTAVKKTAVSD